MAALEQFIQQLKSNVECFGRTLIGLPELLLLIGVQLVRVLWGGGSTPGPGPDGDLMDATRAELALFRQLINDGEVV